MQENSLMTLTDFNIGTVTAETAAALEKHNNIINSMKDAATAMVTLCENLKAMRDTKDYEALGFEKFEEYTEQACGIKKRQAYNYIQTYEKLGSGFLQSNAQLGITKLQLLTEVFAIDRADFVEDNDLENMSVAEVKQLVAQNKERGEQIDRLQNELDDMRNRPIDVAVEQPSEADMKKLVDKRTAEIKAEYKKKLAAAKDKVKNAADKERITAVDAARKKAREEARAEFKEQLDRAEAEKVEAFKQAEQMAARLDKNADADLVTASLYFTEAQKQLENFTAAVAKIEAADPDKAAKLRAAASAQLRQYIER